jgi:hypothetical protein
MKRLLPAVALFLGWGATGLTGAAELHAQDFADGMPIEAPSPGTAYRVTIPVEVFMKAAHEDLRDLRVFNASSEVVPYELRQAPPQPVSRPRGPALPLFALHGDARASLNGVRVTIQAQGTAVDLQTSAPTADPHVITSYVLDAREIAQPLSGLQLHWAEGAPEFSGSLRIDSSDDLGSWHLLKSDAPIIHLMTGGSELIQSRLEFPSAKARFWRLTWVGKTAPFELTSVTAEATLNQPLAPQSTVTVTPNLGTHRESELSFDLGASLPVTQVNLVLPESNSVRKIELLSRARAADTWRQVAQAEFYRVSTGSSEHANEPIRIPTDTDRYWLARQTQPTAPISSLELQVTWDAMDVVFLAQGTGPFLLAYGNASVDSASVSLDPLLKGITVIQAQTGPSYVLGGADRLRPPPRTVPWRMTVLWLALGFGVVLLAWMAYRLLRELTDQTQRPED